jgi:hypothetical protein
MRRGLNSLEKMLQYNEKNKECDKNHLNRRFQHAIMNAHIVTDNVSDNYPIHNKHGF